MPPLRVNQDVTLHYNDDDFTDPWRPAHARAQGYFCDTHMQELRIRHTPASVP